MLRRRSRRALVVLGSRFTQAAMLALLLVGCGGKYVDDKHNFERALRFNRPKDVQLVHSIYWQSPHFTDEHCYYLELLPAQGSTIVKTLTTVADVVPITPEQFVGLPKVAIERPQWFAPKPLVAYEIWTSTNRLWVFGVLRDKSDGRVFVYGEQL